MRTQGEKRLVAGRGLASPEGQSPEGQAPPVAAARRPRACVVELRVAVGSPRLAAFLMVSFTR